MQSVKVAATKYLQLFTIILFIAIILNYSYKGLSLALRIIFQEQGVCCWAHPILFGLGL